MKVGDLVQQTALLEARDDWGYGYVIEVHRTMYKNHVPFVSVYWPTWKKIVKGSQVYLEVLNEN